MAGVLLSEQSLFYRTIKTLTKKFDQISVGERSHNNKQF